MENIKTLLTTTKYPDITKIIKTLIFRILQKNATDKFLTDGKLKLLLVFPHKYNSVITDNITNTLHAVNNIIKHELLIDFTPEQLELLDKLTRTAPDYPAYIPIVNDQVTYKTTIASLKYNYIDMDDHIIYNFIITKTVEILDKFNPAQIKHVLDILFTPKLSISNMFNMLLSILDQSQLTNCSAGSG